MHQRRSLLVEYLRRTGFATVDELAARSGASAITIRRDLTTLEEEGLVRRTHGGAVPQAEGLGAVHIHVRLGEFPDRKRAIARFAAGLIEPNASLFLDAGSTCAALAEALPENRNLTVITHSVTVVNVLKRRAGVRLIALGGEFDAALDACLGPVTEMNLARFTIDQAFLGASGIDPRQGCVNNSVSETTIKQTVNRQVHRSVILADSSKFGAHGLYKTIPIEEVRRLVSDDCATPAQIQALQAAGVQVDLAPVSGIPAAAAAEPVVRGDRAGSGASNP